MDNGALTGFLHSVCREHSAYCHI